MTSKVFFLSTRLFSGSERMEIFDEVIEGYKKQSIEVSFSGALRHIIREYKKMKERA